MRFTPKTEDEIARESLLPKGTYPFTVQEATDAVSKKGNEMIKLKLLVFGKDKEITTFDYLMEAMAKKLVHFCRHAGLTEKYEAGDLEASDCEGREGYLMLDVEEASGKYQAKNVVIDYVPAPEGEQAVAPPKKVTAGLDDEDEIPF